MAKLDLTQYGITGSRVIAHNPSYEFLFEEEMKPELTGYDKGQLTELDAVNVLPAVRLRTSTSSTTPRATTRCGGPPRSTRTTTTP